MSIGKKGSGQRTSRSTDLEAIGTGLSNFSSKVCCGSVVLTCFNFVAAGLALMFKRLGRAKDFRLFSEAPLSEGLGLAKGAFGRGKVVGEVVVMMWTTRKEQHGLWGTLESMWSI